MNEREDGFPDQGDSGDNESCVQIFVQSEELVVQADGTKFVEGHALVAGTDHEIMREAVQSFAEERGVEIFNYGIDPKPDDSDEGASVHYFSSSNWHAPWQPKGPKRNWGPPPDPSLN